MLKKFISYITSSLLIGIGSIVGGSALLYANPFERFNMEQGNNLSLKIAAVR